MITLYGHANLHSPNSLKLRVALHECGAEAQYVPVDLARREQFAAEFVALNPHAKVPVLVEDGWALPESDAILWYLAERFPAAGLLGPTPRSRAQALRWLDFASTALYPAYYDLWRHAHSLPEPERNPAVAADARLRLDRALDVLETVTSAAGGDVFLAGAYSVGDIGAAAVLEGLRRRCPSVPPFAGRPCAQVWFERVTARPAFAACLVG